MRYQLILFDLDDTLFEWYPFWKAGMMATMRVHHSTRDFDTETVFSTFDRYSLSLLPGIEQGKLDWPAYRRMRYTETMRHLGKEADKETADDFMALFHELKMDYLKPNPAVVRMVKDLAANHRLGIVTNGPADQQYHKVDNLQLSPFFPDETIFVSEEIGFSKPDARIFQRVLDHFSVEPNKALFVGDSWEADVVGAIDAGMDAVWVNPRSESPTTKHEPLAAIEHVSELGQVFVKSLRNG